MTDCAPISEKILALSTILESPVLAQINSDVQAIAEERRIACEQLAEVTTDRDNLALRCAALISERDALQAELAALRAGDGGSTNLANVRLELENCQRAREEMTSQVAAAAQVRSTIAALVAERDELQARVAKMIADGRGGA